MSTTDQHLKRIQDKVQQLLKHYSALQKENESLRKELETVKKEAAQYQEVADGLKQQVSVLKLNAGDMNETDKKELEKRINAYLKEIDRCIVMLGE